ncbi:MAG: hypothetical protein ACREH4_08230 [Vitreimonas sp.]
MTIATEIDNRAKLLLHVARRSIQQTPGVDGVCQETIDQTALARSVLALVAATDERPGEANTMAGVVMAIIHDARERGEDFADARQSFNAMFAQLWKATLPGADAHAAEPLN